MLPRGATPLNCSQFAFPRPVADIPRDSPSGNSRDKASVACNCSLRDKRSEGIRLERNAKLRERCRVLCIDVKLGGSEGYPLGAFPSESGMAESILAVFVHVRACVCACVHDGRWSCFVFNSTGISEVRVFS